MDPVTIITSALAILGAVNATYETIGKIKDLPAAFTKVQERLPLAEKLLHDAQERLDATPLTERQRTAIISILKSCEAKAKDLQQIFEAIESKCKEDQDAAKVWQRVRGWYRDAARASKARRVETLMTDIMEDIERLAWQEVFRSATQDDMEEIKKAIEDLRQVEQSLEDSDLEEGNSVHATQNVAAGAFGNQNVVSGGSSHSFYAGKYSAQTINIGGTEHHFLRELFAPGQVNPETEKHRIQRQKAGHGGPLRECYQWILGHADFKKWRDGNESRLLWITGDPGKGKTMLLCGIIDELHASPPAKVAYFFCQATDKRLSTSIAVLRGLVALFFVTQPHLRRKYDDTDLGFSLDINSWDALSKMFAEILEDPHLQETYIVVDALDECVEGLDELLRLILQISAPQVKVLVSSRPGAAFELGLSYVGQGNPLTTVSLELSSDAVAAAVECFTKYKVNQLGRAYKTAVRDAMEQYLSINAQGTFLWVALVCQEFASRPVLESQALRQLQTFPPGLNSLYHRIARLVLDPSSPTYSDLSHRILALTLVVYRPLSLAEMLLLVEWPTGLPRELTVLEGAIGFCRSLLTVEAGVVRLVHQSAKDFLEENHPGIYSQSKEDEHLRIAFLSLEAMPDFLRRNILDLPWPPSPTPIIAIPEHHPLHTIQYACLYWIAHLQYGTWTDPTRAHECLREDGPVHLFFQQHILHWLEALALFESTYLAIWSLESLVNQIELLPIEAPIHMQVKRKGFRQRVSGIFGASAQNTAPARVSTEQLRDLVYDAWRFSRYHMNGITLDPRQLYCSGLLFSPSDSVVRNMFSSDAPAFVSVFPAMEREWSRCLQTIEGHVGAVDFSPDGQTIASASGDGLIKIWDTASGQCRRSWEGHKHRVGAVAFSPDGNLLASYAWPGNTKVWDLRTFKALRAFRGRKSLGSSLVFSPDAQLLATACNYKPGVEVWAVNSDQSPRIFEVRVHSVWSLAFSRDSTQILAGLSSGTIKIWDVTTGQCVRTLGGHASRVTAMSFTSSGKFVSCCLDMIKTWDPASGWSAQTVLTSKSKVLAVASGRPMLAAIDDSKLSIVDLVTYRKRFLGYHNVTVRSAAFSSDGCALASCSGDGMIKVWDVRCLDFASSEQEDGETNKTWPLISSDQKRALSMIGDRVEMWELDIFRLRQTTRLAYGDILPGKVLATSPTLDYIVLVERLMMSGAMFDSNKIVLQDVSRGTEEILAGPKEHGFVAFSPDGSSLAMALRSKIKMWRLSPLKKWELKWEAHHGDIPTTATPDDPELFIVGIGFISDGTRVISMCEDDTVHLRDTISGRFDGAVELHEACLSWPGRSLHPTFIPTIFGVWDVERVRQVSKVWEAFSGQFLRPCSHSDHHQQCGRPDLCVSEDGAWILWKGQRLLWLPLEYRSAEWDAVGTTLLIGHRRGPFLCLRFSKEFLDGTGSQGGHGSRSILVT